MLEIQSRIGLWAYHHLQHIDGWYGIPAKPPFRWVEQLQIKVLESLIPRCQGELCIEKGDPCPLRGYGEDDEEAVYWYCSRHAKEHGFCFVCGEFWGGTESFDFGPGYCSNCASEFEEEEYEGPEWEYDE